MNYPSIAAQIVAAVGGRENLSNVMHCATRLRLTCLDESKIDADTIAELEGVKGVFNAKGQFQIIFGSGTVNQVCDEVLKLTGGQPVQPQAKTGRQRDQPLHQDAQRYLRADHSGNCRGRPVDGHQ